MEINLNLFGKEKKSKKNNAVYILLDRTGSMMGLWDEAVTSINTYVKGLKKNVDVYLACFDAQGFDVLRECKKKDFEELKANEVSPRGLTNLYDASAKVMNQMLEDNNDRAVFVVMTDGYENSSREYTQKDVQKLMDKLGKKEWPTVFLGANFDEVDKVAVTLDANFNTANTAGIAKGKFGLAMNISARNTENYFMAKRGTTAFATAMAYTDEEKEELSKED